MNDCAEVNVRFPGDVREVDVLQLITEGFEIDEAGDFEERQRDLPWTHYI